MTTPLNASDDDLHAYADDLLAAERRAEIETELARDPEAAARGAEFQLASDGAGNSIFYWLDERFGYAEVPRSPMLIILALQSIEIEAGGSVLTTQ